MPRKKAEPMTTQASSTGGNSKEPQFARITKRIPRESGGQKTAKERALAGTYRVIHGNVVLPRPESDWKNPDGTLKKGEPTLDVAYLGDEIWLGDEDAMRLLDSNIVEELDAKPSRVPVLNKQTGDYEGGVFKRPLTIPNPNAIGGHRN